MSTNTPVPDPTQQSPSSASPQLGHSAPDGQASTARVTIKELTAGHRVQSTFLVAKSRRDIARNGNPYLAVTLTDATGRVDGKVFDRADELSDQLVEGTIAHVSANVQVFREALQLVIDDAQGVPAGSVDLGEFLPKTPFSVDAMWTELKRVVATIEDPWVRRFLDELLTTRGVEQRLRHAPAAIKMHHAWLGGLLEHILSLCRLADAMAGHYAAYYPGLIDRSLLVAGAILHDFGKLWELSYETSFDYTDDGNLVGHLVMGVELIGAMTKKIDGFPKETARHLKHLVVGHHGKYEFGSPKLPMTPEAIVLHYIDDLDSKVNAVHTALERAGDARWTEYNRPMRRQLFNVYATRERPDGPAPYLPGVAALAAHPAAAPSAPSTAAAPARTEPPPRTHRPSSGPLAGAVANVVANATGGIEEPPITHKVISD